uniref:PEGA domain-containing protein n=1 Tax=Thermoanaerobaculum aquaticum TaxID=1312852 RepID=A0A7C2SR10_9BACT
MATPTPVVEVPVEIVAVPPAFVVVDGRELGKIARETIHLAPGRYEVTFSIPGYRRESRTVVVDEATREIRLTMPPYGLLSVVPEFGTPLAGSQVFFGNRLLGSLPVVNAKVPEGTDLLRVTWPDGSVFEVSCQVEAERVTTVLVAKPY